VIRVERDGVEHPNPVEVTPGADITGVRVVVAYANARLIGQLKFEGVEPEGTRVMVAARRLADNLSSFPGGQVDGRGKFIIEKLLPGEYELTVRFMPITGGRVRPMKPIRRTASVTPGDNQVTIVVPSDFNR
jgi:hypothetical protein